MKHFVVIVRFCRSAELCTLLRFCKGQEYKIIPSSLFDNYVLKLLFSLSHFLAVIVLFSLRYKYIGYLYNSYSIIKIETFRSMALMSFSRLFSRGALYRLGSNGEPLLYNCFNKFYCVIINHTKSQQI